MAQKEVKQWITVKGKHVPIFEGETKADAVKRVAGKLDDAKKQSDNKSTGSGKLNKATDNALKQLNFDRPGDYAEITDRHWGRLGVSNEKMAEMMSAKDPKYDYEYEKETTQDKRFGKVTHHRMYRVPKEGEKRNQIDKDNDIKEKQIADNEKQANKKKEQWEKEHGKKESGSKFGKEMNDRISKYQDKFLKGKSDKQIEEIKNNLEKSSKITGTSEQDHIALAAIRKEQEARKSGGADSKQAYKKVEGGHEVTVERRGEKVSMKSYGEGWEDGYHVEHTDYVGGKFIDKGKVGDYEIGDTVDYKNGSSTKSGTIVMAHKYPNGEVEYTVKDKDGDGHSMPASNFAKQNSTQKQIAKDLDTKEKQIAKNKADVDRLNGKKDDRQTKIDTYNEKVLNKRYEERQKFSKAGDGQFIVDFDEIGGTMKSFEDMAKRKGFEVVRSDGESVTLRKSSGSSKKESSVQYDTSKSKSYKVKGAVSGIKSAKEMMGRSDLTLHEAGRSARDTTYHIKTKDGQLVGKITESNIAREGKMELYQAKTTSVATLRKQALAAGYSKEKIQGMSAQALKKLLHG